IGQKNSSNDTTLKKISELLINGKVGVLPTATIYGLSCVCYDEDAVKKIYSIKKRKSGTPFIVLISSISQLGILAGEINDPVRKLIAKYWDVKKPYPLTLILSKNESINSFITGGRSTIAIRMAGLKTIRDIIDQTGPIVSTSATLSGTMVQPRTLDEVPGEIKQGADFVVDHGSDLGGKESTIVDLTGKEPLLLRQGALDYEDILRDLYDY
ncbi:L-threonylcarbamoyladenylate synthase, partial [Actinomycetota bacterium]